MRQLIQIRGESFFLFLCGHSYGKLESDKPLSTDALPQHLSASHLSTGSLSGSISLIGNDFPCSFSFLSFSLLYISGSAPGQSGSVGTGQPVVNAIRSDSALIGGTVALPLFSVNQLRDMFYIYTYT